MTREKEDASESEANDQDVTFIVPAVSPGSGSGGFFSLGESNIAERARKLKEEQQNKANTTNGRSSDAGNEDDDETGDTSNNGISAKDSSEEMGDLHEFDSLFISNQIEEKENTLFKTLVDGFKSLKVLRDDSFMVDSSGQRKHNKVMDRRQYSATVNFIDPTTKSASATSPSSGNATNKTTNMLQQQSMFQKQDNSSPTKSIENVYEKITYIFERDYRSTLRSVQYKNLRTGETDYIGSLPVNPVITRTGVATDTKADKNVNTPWGGTSSTAIVPVSDPAEWHTGPFCHVYIAASESMDHYQTKVRPALQAFVSQIESAASNTAANQRGGHSADYLIVYIPVGGGASASNIKDSALSPDGSSSSRRGLFQRARKRWTAGTGGAGDDDDAKSIGSLDSGSELPDTTDVDDPDAIAMSVALNLLSKTEQKVYKKIVADFPNGKACVLSTISLDRSDDAMSNPDGVAIRTQEWNTFNRMLGAVVVNGFIDRCRRYKDELKRLDAQRAIAATAAKNSQGSSIGNNSRSQSQKPNPYAFNLGHFFLVKESLAFTYEQMQLPAEALLQYDEFRLYMPDLSDKEERKVRRARRKSKALRDDDNAPSLTEMADSGDFLGFRKKVRTEYDLTAVLDVMRRYLFARELSLLFRMEEPVELLNRCQSFVKAMYSVMLRGLNELSSEDERRQRKSKASMWVLQFSWDVKTASEIFFRGSGDGSDDRSVGSVGSGVDSSVHGMTEGSDESVAAKISELLETSRALFLQLGYTELGGFNPLRDLRKKLPDDLKRPWSPWIPNEIPSDDGNVENRRKLSSPRNRSSERQFLLANSFSSTKTFEDTYLDLCEAIIKMSRKAKRRRLAARLQAEVGEYYVRNGDLESAILIFKQVLKRYRVDQWDRSHFWRLFRLAYCQRTISKPTEYLKTLVSCFSPRIVAVAPMRALCALQDDLEMVLMHPSVGYARYGKLSFLETSLKIPHSSEKRVTIGQGQDRKDIIKRFSSVGGSVEIELTIKSFLPRTIELNSMKLFVVSFNDFMRVLEENSSIEEDHASKVLIVESPVKIDPGQNTFVVEWSPGGVGQYILSTIEMIWKQGYFYYDSLDLPDSLCGIDVLPSEPSHAISISPESLVPGHDQEIVITVDAGADVVSSASLQLYCTKGVSLVPPGQHPGASEWKNECVVELPSMKPGDKQTFKAYVRCDLNEALAQIPLSKEDSMDASLGFNAKLISMYLNVEAGVSEDSERPLMKTVLESFIPVLEKSALSVEQIETNWLESDHRFLLTILLTSNTPYNFFVDEWKIHLPPPIKVSEVTVLNEDLVRRYVSDGDLLSFAFDCYIEDGSGDSNQSPQAPSIRLTLRDDTDKALSLELGLDLTEFFSTIGASKSIDLKVSLPASLELKLAAGQVGNPIPLKYSFDLSCLGAFNKNVKITYCISSDECSWLVGGRTKGVLVIEGAAASCEVIGIPMVSGVLRRFPKVTLTLAEPGGPQVPLPLEVCYPEMFQAVSRNDGIAVASPSSKNQAAA